MPGTTMETKPNLQVFSQIRGSNVQNICWKPFDITHITISYHRILPQYHSGYSLVLSFSPEFSKFGVELQAPTYMGRQQYDMDMYENGCHQNCHNKRGTRMVPSFQPPKLKIEFQKKITTHVCCIVEFFFAKMLSVTFWLFNMDMVQMNIDEPFIDDV